MYKTYNDDIAKPYTDIACEWKMHIHVSYTVKYCTHLIKLQVTQMTATKWDRFYIPLISINRISQSVSQFINLFAIRY
jgi:hypothetical protein